MGLYVNILFFLLFLAFTVYYAKKNFLLAFLYGLVFLQAFSLLPSLIYIETGILISEQRRFSFYTGATILAVLYFIFTFFVIAVSFKTFNKKRLPVFHLGYKGNDIDVKLIVGGLILVQGLLLLNAMLSPSPLFDESISRFTYWEHSKFPFLNSLFGNTSMFIPFGLGLIFFKNRKFSVFMLLVYFGYNFLIGQKFSPIIRGLFSFLLPIVFQYKDSIFYLVKKHFVVLITSFVLLFSTMYYVIYTKYENTRPFAIIKIYDPNEAILYRIFGLQGHLMWGATEQYVANTNNEAPKSFNPAELLYGMREMMEEFAASGAAAVRSNQEKGFNFTNAYPGILFKIFPLSIAFVFHTLVTICFLALMGWVLKELLVQKAYFFSFVAYQLFNWTTYAFIMGYFYKLYYVIFFLVVYGALIYIRNSKYAVKNEI